MIVSVKANIGVRKVQYLGMQGYKMAMHTQKSKYAHRHRHSLNRTNCLKTRPVNCKLTRVNEFEWVSKCSQFIEFNIHPPPSLYCGRAPVEWVQLWIKPRKRRGGKIYVKWQAARCLNWHLNKLTVRFRLCGRLSFFVCDYSLLLCVSGCPSMLQNLKTHLKSTDLPRCREPLSYRAVRNADTERESIVAVLVVSLTAERMSKLQWTATHWPSTPCTCCIP